MTRRKTTPKWLRAAREQGLSPERGLDWLSRALSRAGVLPQPEADQAIRAGRVRLNAHVQRQPMAAVRPGDRVELDGRSVSISAETIALMLHKPRGVVSAAHDPEGVGTVFDVFQLALPDALRGYGWHAIGRLDRNTTGLLLFTNDERLVAHVTSPKTHLPKRYLARVSGRATDERLDPLRRGIVLDDGPTRPATAELCPDGRVALTLTEGRHHQVKRMLGAVGLPVLELHREAIGGLVLDVPEGVLRPLTSSEIEDKLGFRPTP